MSAAEITVSQHGMWRSAVLRPVGELAGRALERLIDDVTAIAQRANIVVVNLVGASIPTPAALARALRRPGALLSGPDKALLLVGADDTLLQELRRHGGDIDPVR
jgi:pimeloyl-ACP methyl ester carboxylesterase